MEAVEAILADRRMGRQLGERLLQELLRLLGIRLGERLGHDAVRLGAIVGLTCLLRDPPRPFQVHGSHPIADARRVEQANGAALAFHQSKNALGFGRIHAGDLVGDVAVMPVEFHFVAQAFGQLQRGRQVEQRQAFGEHGSSVTGPRGRGQVSGVLAALFDHLGRPVFLVPFEEPIGNLSENDDALGRLLVARPSTSACPRSSICDLRLASGNESASCT